MITLLQDVQNNHPFMLASYGSNLALGFKGDPDFIRRSFNWAYNTGVVRRSAELHWYYEADTGRLAYVCPKSLKAIKMGLFRQFEAEIVLSKEIPLKADHSGNDERDESTPIVEHQDYKIVRLAAKRVKEFMDNHFIHDSFFLRRHESILAPYGLGYKSRAENEDFS